MKFIIFAFLFGLGNGYKILVVFPFPGTSHSIIMGSCVEILLKAGHEVTYITPVSQGMQHANLTKIDVNRNKQQKKLIYNVQGFIGSSKRPNILKMMYASNLEASVEILENQEVVDLARDPNTRFDAVVVEWLFGELLAGFAAIFDCPLIWLSSLDPHWMILSLVDEASNPAYVPTHNSLGPPPFNLVQRVGQLFTQTQAYFLKYMAHRNADREYQRVVVPLIKKNPPSYHELIHNGSLVLGFTDILVGQPTTVPQCYKQLGGYHIGKVSPLPDSVQQIMDNAKHGVIYFSIGTVFDSSDFPQQLKEDLLNMFGGLKQTVIWKCEPFVDSPPANVHLMRWTPQHAIMAHPNLLIFITHGGLLSMMEVLHFGVPIIGIPIIADQHLNVNRAVKRGLGKKVDLTFSMADDLRLAVQDLLGNYSKYLAKVEENSAIYHDRLVSAPTQLVYWVEHVIKTRGAPHLRSPSLHVPFYQKLYLDFIGILLILILAVLVVGRMLMRLMSKQVNRMKIKSY